MNDLLEKTLVRRYPCLYKDYGKSPKESGMAWGFSCGDGWFSILTELSEKIDAIDKKNVVVADQVKEKFGGLRFYYHIDGKNQNYDSIRFKIRSWFYNNIFYKLPYKLRDILSAIRKFFYKNLDEKIDELINMAEKQSFKICELCGEPGDAKGGGWISTLCVKCRKKRLSST